MFSSGRPLIRAAAGAAGRPGLRCFTATATQGRTPSMGDIDPAAEKVEAFNKKQKEFREKLADAKKQRDAGALSQSSDSGSSPYVPGLPQGLGSLSTATTDVSKDLDANEPSRKPGRLTDLIYGTKEGREMDAQIEASFSAVLARGKYVHSIVFHEVKPENVDEYVELVGSWYPKVATNGENKVHLVGSWRTEVGDCNTFGTSCFATRHPL
jgi:hypothetical protein